MSDSSNTQITAYNNFIKTPSPQTAFDFVISCHKYITILASKWQQPQMTRKNKINDIISEMYLILLEDFSSGKAITCQSAFAYLDSKLKSLVYPSKTPIFSELDSVSNELVAEKDNFTYERIKMIEEIVNIIRTNVLEDCKDSNGLVLFLFIHIYPKIRWISELLAKKDNIPFEKRYETDIKRVNRFNINLRKQFDNLAFGDWHEIENWNQVERRHLAWKIINISPKEVDEKTSQYLTFIDNWRETFEDSSSKNIEKLEIAEKVYQSMTNYYPKNKTLKVAEEESFWGKPLDIITKLISDFYIKKSQLEEPLNDFNLFDTLSENNENTAENDIEFMEVAKELNNWFGKIMIKRSKTSSESNYI